MKIECSSLVGKKIPFKEIETGHCFLFHKNLWMKIGSPDGKDVSNAVFLENGLTTTFQDDDMVLPCKAKVVYEKE